MVENIEHVINTELFSPILDVKELHRVEVVLINMLSWWQFKNETYHFALDDMNSALIGNLQDQWTKWSCNNPIDTVTKQSKDSLHSF